ncbi:MAG: uroporphyrinogen decarboxylase family protein [Defluviitaleaceae bacterium]|nr:uroporphyrinogen decarboxylase family protein [Defluviitaleaceae bacterium]
MTAMECVAAALAHKETDRTPVYPILAGVTRKLVGASYEEWSINADICAEAFYQSVKRFELDTAVTLIDLSIECDAWGQKIVYNENDAAHPDYGDLVVKEITDYAKIKKVDYKTSKRMMMHIGVCKRLVEKANGEFPVVAFVFGPLGVLSMMRKQENLYMDIYDDPEAVKNATREINETLKEYIHALIDTGVNAVMLDTLFASGSIMSKQMWKDMEGGFVKELADVCHARGCLVMVHNCGERIYFDAQIEAMNPCAISFLHVPDDCKDFAECKEKYGGKITLIGCVSPTLAVTGTDEEWVTECKKHIDTFGKGGGYMLATGCEYPSGADFNKAELMVEVARTYRPY